jgi:hypothetical protein
MELAAAEKTALEALAVTETDVGIVKTLAMAPVRDTETPPEGAGAESVTVQEVLLLEFRPEDPHCSEEINTGAASEILKDAEDPLREAIIVAV